MALDSFNWFIKLAKTGNFTRTAKEVGISQQTLSARLASLEKELSAKLIVRSAPLKLTPAGTEFLHYATEREEARTVMLRRVSQATCGDVGLLKVAIGNMRCRALMPYVIEEFHKGFPGVHIELIEGTNEELVNLAESGEADIVIARFDRSHPGIVTRKLFEERIILVIHPELLQETMGCDVDEAVKRIEKEGLAPLKDCPFLLEDDSDLAGRIAQAAMKKAGVKYEGLVRCKSMYVLLSLCAQGLGAVFCPDTMIDTERASSKILARIPLPDTESYEISIGRPANAEPWTPAQTFEDILGALFGE